jgi:hypothetical protein
MNELTKRRMWVERLRWVVVAAALAAAAVPSHAWWQETQLAGVRLGDDAMILFEMPGYGNPDGIIVSTATPPDNAATIADVAGAQGGLGMGGGGGAGAAAGPGAMMGGAPGAAGAMGPGMMGPGGMGPGMARGTSRGIPGAVSPLTPAQAMMGMAMAPSLNISGPSMTAGQIAGGVGGMMGGGTAPGGMGGPVTVPGGAATPGVGFQTTAGVSDFPDWVMTIWFDLHEDEIEYFYMRGKCAVGFVIKKDTGKIVAISVAGEMCDFARTALAKPHESVKLGDDYKRVIYRYGWPHDQETFVGSGNAMTNFGENTNVTFGGSTNTFRRDCVLWYHELRGEKQSNVAFTLHDMKVTRIHIWIPDPV